MVSSSKKQEMPAVTMATPKHNMIMLQYRPNLDGNIFFAILATGS